MTLHRRPYRELGPSYAPPLPIIMRIRSELREDWRTAKKLARMTWRSVPASGKLGAVAMFTLGSFAGLATRGLI